MSKQLAHLCTLFIRHVYGDLPAEIFATILDSDRLRLLEICSLLSLSVKAVKRGLALLVQQNLLLFHPTDPPTTTFYQANVAQAYSIIRYGKYSKLVHDRLGTDAARIVSSVQALGSATPQELAIPHAFEALRADADEKDHQQPQVNGNREASSDGLVDVNGTSRHDKPNDAEPVDLKAEDFSNKPNKLKRPRHSRNDEAQPGSFAPTEMVRLLQDAGFLEPLCEYTFLPPTDFDMIVEEYIRKTDDAFRESVNGPKKSALFRETINAYKKDILTGRTRLPMDNDSASDGDETGEPPNKKRKVNGTTTTATKQDSPHLRLNTERILLAMRTEVLTRHVCIKIGENFSKIYASFLRILEGQQNTSGEPYKLLPSRKLKYRPSSDNAAEKGCDDGDGDEDEELSGTKLVPVSTKEIADSLDADVVSQMDRDLHWIYHEGPPKDGKEKESQRPNGLPDKTLKSGKRANGEARAVQSTHEDRSRLLENVEKSLRIIARVDLIIEAVEEGSNEWTVDIEQMLRWLVQEELEMAIEARFGPTAKRIVRILHSQGKLDEKTVGTIGMIKPRDVRAFLTQLQRARYIDVQEVPRDNNRQPMRTIYLWYFDQERCREAVLAYIYKTMARLLERHDHERHQVRGLLGKVSRTDVQGNEKQYLNDSEQAALREWREKEHKTFLALSRNDDLVLLFRDFLTPPLAKTPPS